MKEKLIQKESSAKNIKSPNNQKAVLESLSHAKEKINYLSKNRNETFPNGLVIFSGNLKNEQNIFEYFIDIFEPPQELKTFVLSIEGQFQTEILKKMLIQHKKYAYVVLDGSGFIIAISDKNSVEIILQKDEHLPNQHNKGGQS